MLNMVKSFLLIALIVASHTLAAASEWTLVVIPDTQMYFEQPNSIPILDSMLEWIRDHHDEENIVAVLQVGDVTQQNNAAQWTAARKSFSVLDGEVPYFMAVGNHDLGPGGSASTRNTLMNEYFQVGQNPLNEAAFQRSYESDHLENTAYTFEVNQQTILVLTLEFGPRDSVLVWANQAIDEIPHDRAILVTHDYIDELSRRYSADHRPARTTRTDNGSPAKYKLANDKDEPANCGQDMWEMLVSKHDTFQFVFNGHQGDFLVAQADGKLINSTKDIATGYRADPREGGLTVHQLLFNAQFIKNGGDGWMQLVHINDETGTVRVETFSPYFQKRLDIGLEAPSPWRTGPDFAFTVPLR